jgi:ATP-dependent helicase/nuclease subunit B
MPAQVHLVVGPARSGKTQRLLEVYRRAVVGGPLGGCLWIAPSERVVQTLRQELLSHSLAGYFVPGIMTFGQFAAAVLAAADKPHQAISATAQRRLISDLLAELTSRSELRHFGPIAGSVGLLDGVCDAIADLKRLEIWPEELGRACRDKGASAKDLDLLAVYSRYQDVLNRRQLYDAEGRFWSARALLREGQTKPFVAMRTIVLDGFTDFTRTQLEIIELLAARTEELFVSLPLEDPVERSELFSRPLRTLEALERRFKSVQVERLARPPQPTWPAAAHLEQSLFSNPRKAPRPAHGRGVSILAASQTSGEIELVARGVKQLLSAGDPDRPGERVSPNEVVVVFRSLAEYVPLIRQTFDSLGIPHVLEIRPRISDSPLFRALEQTLRLDAEDWPFRRLLGLVRNRMLALGDGSDQTRSAAERAIRPLQIPRGRAKLLARLERVAVAPLAEGLDEPSLRRRSATRGAAEVAHRALLAWAKNFDALPGSATGREWSEALEAFPRARRARARVSSLERPAR